MKRLALLRLGVCLLAVISVVLTCRLVPSMGDGIRGQQVLTNILLCTLCILVVSSRVLKVLDGWGGFNDRTQKKDRKNDVRPKVEEKPLGIKLADEKAGIAEKQKPLEGIREKADFFKGWEESFNPSKTPSDSKAAYPEATLKSGEMVGYAEIANRQDIMFGQAPIMRIISRKGTFTVYQAGNAYFLEPSEHWYGKKVGKEELKNEQFRFLFDMTSFGGDACVLRRGGGPATLSKGMDGTYVLLRKGSILTESI